jgi:hypothetical protein
MKNLKNHGRKNRFDLKLFKEIERLDLVFAAMVTILVASIAIAAGVGQWPNTSSPASVELGEGGWTSYGTRTSDGNYIVAWGGASGVEMQKLNSAGDKLWNSGTAINLDPVLWDILAVSPDNNGGAFITYATDDSLTLTVKRVSSTGTVLWTASDLNNDGGLIEYNVRLMADGSNGVYIVWAAGATTSSMDLYVTHLDSTGGLYTGWNSGGTGTYKPLMLPETVAGGNERYAQLIPSDSGSIIIGYNNTAAKNDLFFTKLSATGGDVWGSRIQLNDANAISYYTATSDGSNGVYLAYNDSKINLAKFNSAGTFSLGTAAGGVEINTFSYATYGINNMTAVSDSSGNLYLNFGAQRYSDSGREVFVQKFGTGGQERWTAGGILISTQQDGISEYSLSPFSEEKPHMIVTDGTGGAVVTVTKSSTVYMQKVSSSGLKEWGTTGYNVTEDLVNHSDSYPELMSDNAGGAVVDFYRWDDTTSTETIRAQKVDDNSIIQAKWPNINSPSVQQIMGSSSNVKIGTVTSDGNYAFAMQGWNSAGPLFVQKMNAVGSKLWNGGSPLQIAESYYAEDIEKDNSGGVFVAYDEKTSDAAVTRINSSGTPQWTAINLNDAPNVEESPRLYNDGSNGVYVIWSGGPSAGTKYLYATHLDSNGSVAATWNTAGSGTYRPLQLPQSGNSDWRNGEHRIVPSSGGFIASYKLADNNIYISKFNSDGTLAWGGGGYVTINDAANVTMHVLESDGSNGAYVGYYASPNLKVAHIDSNGAFLNGSPLQYKNFTTVSWPLVATTDSTGVFYLGWNQLSGGETEAYVQKFNGSLAEQWTAGGVHVSTSGNAISDKISSDSFYDNAETIVPDGSGGVILTANRQSAKIGSAVVLYKVNSSGVNVWGDNGYSVSADPTTSNDYVAELLPDGNGGAVIDWFNDVTDSISAQYYGDIAPEISTPTITGLDVNEGPMMGGTVFTVTGTDFQDGATVEIGNIEAMCFIMGIPTTIRCRTAGIGVEGWYDVVVTNPDSGTATLTDGFHYLITPIVITVDPGSGPTAGGTPFTISGQYIQNGATVTFGGVSATDYSYSGGGTDVSGLTPAHAAGAVDVIVTNPAPDGGSTIITDGFNYSDCVPGPHETCSSVTIGCQAGSVSISASPSVTFEPRNTAFYNDASNAPLINTDLTVDLTDTRSYDPDPAQSCGAGATIQIQSPGLSVGGLGGDPILDISLNTAPAFNCATSCEPATITDIATLTNATGSVATAKDLVSTSEAFSGTIRTTLSGTDIEIVKPTAVIPQGNYSGTITFTQL